jgi:glycosyltransferase involved in cell wall biosynthesis
MCGSVWDADELDELYAHCRLYVHGHSVGGTNPALLRAMGAAAPVVALDVAFNREVLGETGEFFDNAQQLAALMDSAGERRSLLVERGRAGRRRAEELYDWDQVAAGYESLCQSLAEGRSS